MATAPRRTRKFAPRLPFVASAATALAVAVLLAGCGSNAAPVETPRPIQPPTVLLQLYYLTVTIDCTQPANARHPQCIKTRRENK